MTHSKLTIAFAAFGVLGSRLVVGTFEGDEGFGSGSVVGGPGGGFVLRAVFGCQGGGSSDSPQADDASSQALSVAYVRDFYPYASKKIDEPQGFSIDVVRDIADASRP